MITPELTNYVRIQLAAGVTKADLQTALSAQGWSQPDIDSVFLSVQPPTPTPSPTLIPATPVTTTKPGFKIPALWIAGVVLVLLLGAGGVFAYPYVIQNFAPSPLTLEPQVPEQQTPAPVTTPATSTTPTATTTSTIMTVKKVPSNFVFDMENETPTLDLSITVATTSADPNTISLCMTMVDGLDKPVSETDCSPLGKYGTQSWLVNFDMNLAPDLSRKDFWTPGTHDMKVSFALVAGKRNDWSSEATRQKFPALAEGNTGTFKLLIPAKAVN